MISHILCNSFEFYAFVQTDPDSGLDLADFACREVSVRFAVLSVNGLSGYSESTRIPQVYGGRLEEYLLFLCILPSAILYVSKDKCI